VTRQWYGLPLDVKADVATYFSECRADGHTAFIYDAYAGPVGTGSCCSIPQTALGVAGLRLCCEGTYDPHGMATDNRLQEHLWFTATTVGVNAFLLTRASAVSAWTTVPVSTVVSAFAGYLIVERSRGEERRGVPLLSQLRAVVKEFSGALFLLAAGRHLVGWCGLLLDLADAPRWLTRDPVHGGDGGRTKLGLRRSRSASTFPSVAPVAMASANRSR
jgi:hypothetical protein